MHLEPAGGGSEPNAGLRLHLHLHLHLHPHSFRVHCIALHVKKTDSMTLMHACRRRTGRICTYSEQGSLMCKNSIRVYMLKYMRAGRRRTDCGLASCREKCRMSVELTVSRLDLLLYQNHNCEASNAMTWRGYKRNRNCV